LANANNDSEKNVRKTVVLLSRGSEAFMKI
jgi:hypothetical protein